MTLIKKIFRSIVGDPVIRHETDSDGFPLYEWPHPRLRHAEVWLFGGAYGARGPYYANAAPQRAWAWGLSQCRYLHDLWVAACSYRTDLSVRVARFWLALRGKPYHHCPKCSRGVCVIGVRDQLKARTESERLAVLSRSSLSNDLGRLHEQLRSRGFKMCRGAQ